MEPDGQRLLTDALRFALRAHADQTRKGTDVPYVSHLLRVSGRVLEWGGSVELAVVALLHDSIEDCDDVDEATLAAEFGDAIAARVTVLSDVLPGDTVARKSPWRARKEAYIARLAEADHGTRLVAACDKLDNLESLLADLGTDGSATLDRFSGSPRQTRWYYETVQGVLGTDLPQGLGHALSRGISELSAWIPEASPEP